MRAFLLAPLLLRLPAAAAGGAPDVPAAPWTPHELHQPTVQCTVDLPAGWTSGTPMPDHILELWLPTDAGMPLPAMMVEEGAPAQTLKAAVADDQARVKRSWAGDPTLRLVEEAALNGRMTGTLVRFGKAPHRGSPVEPLWAARARDVMQVWNSLNCQRAAR